MKCCVYCENESTFASSLREPAPTPQIEIQTEHTINREEALQMIGELIEQVLVDMNSPLLDKNLEEAVSEVLVVVLPNESNSSECDSDETNSD